MTDKRDVGHILLNAISRDGQWFGEYEINRLLCASAAGVMEQKLIASMQKGRGGWYSKDCTIEELRAMLKEHVSKGDMVDIMNIAAMIYAKEAMIEAQACA